MACTASESNDAQLKAVRREQRPDDTVARHGATDGRARRIRASSTGRLRRRSSIDRSSAGSPPRAAAEGRRCTAAHEQPQPARVADEGNGCASTPRTFVSRPSPLTPTTQAERMRRPAFSGREWRQCVRTRLGPSSSANRTDHSRPCENRQAVQSASAPAGLQGQPARQQPARGATRRRRSAARTLRESRRAGQDPARTPSS